MISRSRPVSRSRRWKCKIWTKSSWSIHSRASGRSAPEYSCRATSYFSPIYSMPAIKRETTVQVLQYIPRFNNWWYFSSQCFSRGMHEEGFTRGIICGGNHTSCSRQIQKKVQQNDCHDWTFLRQTQFRCFRDRQFATCQTCRIRTWAK